MEARKIEPIMIDYIDSKLNQNGFALEAFKTKNARNLFIEAFKACVGIHEEGFNNGKMVKLIQETIGGANQEAWCMATVQTMIAYVEVKLGIISRIYPSEHCLTVWEKTPQECRVNYFPLPGAIIIWQHGKKSNGHTGAFLEADHDIMLTVEGNTGADRGDTINSDGDGIYIKHRSMKNNGDMHVVGFLKPF